MNRRHRIWTGKQRTTLILQLIKGRVRLPEVCSQYQLEAAEVGRWVDVFLEAGERSLSDLK